MRQAAEILGVHENTVRNWAKSGRLPGSALPGSGFHRFRRSEVETVKKAMAEGPSYHDLHITTDTIPRTSIFNLPYNVEVKCNRVAGWEVWDSSQGGAWRLLGGEYNAEPEENEEGRPVRGGLRLDVVGFVIVDSLGKASEPICKHGRTASHSYPSRRRWTGGFEVCPGPVATPTEPEWRATLSGRLLGRNPDRIERHNCGCVTGWDDAYEQCVLIRCGRHSAASPIPAEQPEQR